MLLAVAAWTGCEEQVSPSASTPTPVVANDSAAAYAALSESLERCDDNYATCAAAAGNNAAAKAQCGSERDACDNAAGPMAAAAQSKLENETHHCRAVCTDEDAGPGADSADAGSGDMNECLGHHAPHLPKCLAGLFSCLVDAGVFHRSATGGEIRGCVREANMCILDELRDLRERRHHHGQAGSSVPAAGSGGSSAGSSGSATAGNGGNSGLAGNVVDAGAGDNDDQGDENSGRGRGRHARRFGFWHF